MPLANFVPYSGIPNVPLWQGLDETVRNYLVGFTLVDVLHMKK